MYPVLHELGLANKPRAVTRYDGLKLRHAWIASVVRCAPPGDKPLPQEIRNCGIHLAQEIQALPRVRVVVCLGKIAFDGYMAFLLQTGVILANRTTVSRTGLNISSPMAFICSPLTTRRCATPIQAASTGSCSPASSCAQGNWPALLSKAR